MKKILIISNFFHPEITPRAFRTTELVREFCRQGDQVTLVLPNKEVYQEDPIEADNLLIVYSRSLLIKTPAKIENEQSFSSQSRGDGFKSQIIKYLKKIAIYFFPRELFLVFDKGITKALQNLTGSYDGLISISHPLSIHLSTTMALMKNRAIRCKVTVAEFSDPMFKGQYFKTFPINWLFGFLFSWRFKYFIVPVATAIPAFLYFKSRKNIKVISQGFDLSNILINNYIPNTVTTFAYAGRFYKDLRDPEYFLKFLETIDTDFIFKLYVPRNDVYFVELINDYAKKVKGKLVICDIIPRELLIRELSGLEFLVNFNNEDRKMVPSKLIDYALTKRPTISFNSQTFDGNVFKEFLEAKYDQAVKINVEDYDIKKVVKSFKELIK